ncbi:MAG TPA: transporter substrate-binding domain-containing protein, partial [Gammaproteobacteria bacterium]
MQTRLFTHLLAVVLLPLLIAACSQPENELQRIQQEGKLVVLTRNAATAYFEGPGGGPTGLEYDLASGFAEELGVGLEMVVASNVSEVLGKLAEGEADLAAAGLTITAPRESWARFSTPYQEITQQLVYRVGTRRPPSLDKLNGQLEIIARSSHAEQLQQLKSQHASLSWTENSKAESEEL